SKEKESLEKEVEDVESQIDANYFEGFNCAKNQALLLCPGESKLLQTMCPWGRVKDGKIVEDEEDDDLDDEVPNN
ncbi:hypothetical protein A2U01_0063658, partial [Trifolium medium]|nr:hypothetical protein [Trifolium medium]